MEPEAFNIICSLFAISQLNKEFHQTPWSTVMLNNKTRVISFDTLKFKIIVFSSLLGQTKLPFTVNQKWTSLESDAVS